MIFFDKIVKLLFTDIPCSDINDIAHTTKIVKIKWR